MARVGFRGGAMLAPVPPTLISVRDEAKGGANLITVAWTGILSTVPPKTYVSVRPTRYSHKLLTESREFVINLPPVALARQVDYCGMYTGAKVNKFEKTGLTPVPSTAVSAPTVEECPISLECRVTEIVSLGSHDMFIADIVAVTADEKLLDENGKLHFEKADLCAYVHGEYFALGKALGNFGFSAVKKGKRKPRREKKKDSSKADKT